MTKKVIFLFISTLFDKNKYYNQNGDKNEDTR